MERVTLRMTKHQVQELERRVESGEFANRSEAIRAAVRETLKDDDSGGDRPWTRV